MTTKLFAVGFPREMEEMEVAQLFGPFGDVQLLTIARDKMSGKSKGFAFIHMDERGALAAIENLNGLEIADRRLEVRIAEDKQETAKPVFKRKAPDYVPVEKQPLKKKRPRISK